MNHWCQPATKGAGKDYGFLPHRVAFEGFTLFVWPYPLELPAWVIWDASAHFPRLTPCFAGRSRPNQSMELQGNQKKGFKFYAGAFGALRCHGGSVCANCVELKIGLLQRPIYLYIYILCRCSSPYPKFQWTRGGFAKMVAPQNPLVVQFHNWKGDS